MIQGVLEFVDVIRVGSFQCQKSSFAGRKDAAQHRDAGIVHIVEKQSRTLDIAGLTDVGGDFEFQIHRLSGPEQLPSRFEKSDKFP